MQHQQQQQTQCFSMSAEIGEHKKDHGYTLRTTSSFPLFDSDKPWSYKEEFLLLQFIEQCGFGNWDEVAKHMGTNRTADGSSSFIIVHSFFHCPNKFCFCCHSECMQHYHSYYIYGNLGKCKLHSTPVRSLSR